MMSNLNSWLSGRFERAMTCYAQLICALSLIFTASVFGDVVANSTTPDSISIPGAGSEVCPDSVPDRRHSEPLLSTPRVLASEALPGPTEHQELGAKLVEASKKRSEKDFAAAERVLVSLLKSEVPPEIQQAALLEMAVVADEANDSSKAQQIYAEYLKRYPDDPGTSEVLLRQGLLFRKMGANVMALSKFYAVLSTVLRVKPDRLDHYQRLVVQAQAEIAETYYLQGKYVEAVDFLGRLLKLDASELQKAQIVHKLIQSLSALERFPEVIAKAQDFVDRYPSANQLPEVRFLLANAFRKLARDREAVQQVMALLDGQEKSAQRNPGNWHYWRQRAGNEIANHLYSNSDYINALAIYKSLADLDSSPAWRLPVWYQMGLAYERLQQPQKAIECYGKILLAEKGLSAANTLPSLSVVREMAQWRRSQLEWLMQAEKSNEHLSVSTSAQTPLTSDESSSANP